ncbi:hypothetical protein PIB30_033809 [Stylosanthes scabra]|uniref:Uncharacterized protein n=1 Tax=Stylosanthes scabra TaxID=79078 RepID=A0ABU6XEF3_9FABA|nr:hypothetical protein [Stylosanthes scabra]
MEASKVIDSNIPSVLAIDTVEICLYNGRLATLVPQRFQPNHSSSSSCHRRSRPSGSSSPSESRLNVNVATVLLAWVSASARASPPTNPPSSAFVRLSHHLFSVSNLLLVKISSGAGNHDSLRSSSIGHMMFCHCRSPAVLVAIISQPPPHFRHHSRIYAFIKKFSKTLTSQF